MSKVIYVFFGLFILYGGITCVKSGHRITYGSLADSATDNLAFQVALQDETGRIYCGGTILDERYVLTAAHCVDGHEPGSITVIVGSNDLESEAGMRHLVSNMIQHEEFEPHRKTNPPNDIALLRLALPIVFNNRYVAPALLPYRDYQLPDGEMVVVSGFGKPIVSDLVSSKLYKRFVFIVSNSECQQSYSPGLIKKTNVCAAYPGRITGAFRGDYGGPLSVNGTVIGVVSFSLDGYANTSIAPQVYTRVSEYVDWINHWRTI